MKTSIFNKKSVSRWVVAFTLWTTVTTASAATRTWSGLGGDGNWQTSGNWDTVPVATDVLAFDGNTQVVNTNDFLEGTQFNGLYFGLGSGAFMLEGNALKLAGSITNVSANPQVINLGLTNTTAFTVYCETNVTLGGIVQGGTTLTKRGPGKLVLNNSGIALNRLNLDGGTIDLASDFTLGPVNYGGTTLAGTGGTITSSGGRILLGGGNGAANGPDWFGGSSSPIVIEAPIADGVTLYNNVDYYNSGNLILRGANTYTGGTGFQGTYVQVGVDCVGTVGAIESGPFGTGPLNFAYGHMSSDGATPRTILNDINFTGTMELGNPSLTGKLTFSSAVNLSGGARTVTAVSEVQFDGALTNGGFVKAGAALVTLAGANTYAGGTTISSNRLIITGSILDTGAFTLNNPTAIYTVDTALKVGALTLTDGTIDGAGAVTGTSYTVSSGLISANLGGDATLTKTGAGTVTLSGANTYTTTVVSAGILLHAKPSALYNGDTGSWTKEKITVLNGATLAFNVGGPGEFTVEELSTLRSDLTTDINTNGFRAGAKIGFDTSNFPGGTFELTESIGNSTGLGAGALGIAKLGSNTMSLAVANTYTGETMVNGGTLLVNHANALTTGTTLTAGGTGTLDLNGYNFTVANLGVGGAGGTITDNASGTGTNTLTVTAYTPALATFLTDGPTRKLALRVANSNNGNRFVNNTNTFSGGLTLFGTYTRLNISAAPVNTGTAGAIVSSPFGRGPITLGETSADKAQLFMSVANVNILNDIVFNTSLGTDVASSIRADYLGLTLAGTLTANLAPVTLGNNTAGATAFLTGQITGTNGLWLRGGYDMTVTLNNATANPNNYEGRTTIDAGKKLVLGTNEQIPHGLGKGDVYVYGRLNLNGYTETLNGLYGTGTVDGGGTTTLKIGENNVSSSFLGVITNSSGALTVFKTGSGTMSLATPLRHSGAVVVENGTLLLPYRAPGASTPVAGMVRWFDASSPDYVLTNSAGSVTNWMDRSGNNAHAVNGSGIRLPTYTYNSLNSMGALLCAPTNTTTGYGQYLQFPRLTNIRTVFSVFKGGSFLLTDTTDYHFHRPNDTDPAVALWHTTYTSANIRNGATYVNGVLTNGTTYAMPTTFNNGFNLVEVLTTGNVNADSFNRDRNVSRSGNQSHAEVLIYNRVLTEEECLQNEGYLMSKWLKDPFIPTGSTLTVLSGGVLDLNGHSQEIATLKGDGSVSNGTLVVANAIDLTNEVASAIAVNGSLTMKPGAALQIDHTASASDVVNVSGTLKIEGANTVLLNTLSGALPPFRVTLFSFGTLDGQENLSSWSVDLPPELQNYETRFHAENNQVYVNVFLSGTVIQLK